MRPRVFPAEDARWYYARGNRNGASMRPRVFPAEDPTSSPLRARASTGFNEAAGIPRGRPRRGAAEVRCRRRASMRPRVFPAEDPVERLIAPSMAGLQ